MGKRSLLPKRIVIYALSMQWQANPTIETLPSYSLSYKLKFFETILPRLRNVYVCRKAKSGSLYTIYVRYDAPRF